VALDNIVVIEDISNEHNDEYNILERNVIEFYFFSFPETICKLVTKFVTQTNDLTSDPPRYIVADENKYWRPILLFTIAIGLSEINSIYFNQLRRLSVCHNLWE